MPARKAAAVPHNVASALVIKEEDVFFLCQPNGQVPLGNQDGFGLYWRDCCFLNGYEVRIAGLPPNPLASTSASGFMAEFELTNAQGSDAGKDTLHQQQVGVFWRRAIDNGRRALHDSLELTNFGVRPAVFPLTFDFAAHFDDVFEIRGLEPRKRGRALRPRWSKGVLYFSYRGADGVFRTIEVHFSPAARPSGRSGAQLHLRIAPGKTARVQVSLLLSELKRQSEARPQKRAHFQFPAIAARLQQSAHGDFQRNTEVRSGSDLLTSVIKRSLRDLRVLRSRLDRLQFIAAGLPWYGTLFGRDSIIAALQLLAYDPSIAGQTLRLLAAYQGSKSDGWRDEQPGKILHELRRGELANLNEIPQTPYFGSVDSTPLFLILMAEYVRWTGDLALFRRLHGNVERAFAWIDRYGDRDGDGYLSYESQSAKGLSNQGWKDSGDSIMNADGSLATPPIALVEVQGYVYLAKQGIAGLYDRSGDRATAARLRREAAELRARFNRDFWLRDKRFYALALEKNGRPAAVIASNPGQALWSGICHPEKARATAHRLLQPDMFSGWGVRTLSSEERRYNPIGYHLGTVWPHDNSVILAGLRRYGFAEQACAIFTGIAQASASFANHRLPELFCGFAREQYPSPVRYPVACHPQAWAAGSVPWMLTSLLGLEPQALAGRLAVRAPILPSWIPDVELRGLRVSRAQVDLRFQRTAAGSASVQILDQRGKLEIDIEDTAEQSAA